MTDLAATPAAVAFPDACRELAEVAASALPGRDWRPVGGGLPAHLFEVRVAALGLRHAGRWALSHAVSEAAGELIVAAGWRVLEGVLERDKRWAGDGAEEIGRARGHLADARRIMGEEADR